MAGKQNFTIEKRASFEKRLIWRNKSKRPMNLTGYTAKLQVRASANDIPVLLEMSSANGKIILGGTSGTIDLFLSAADTAAIVFASGVYDLILTPPGATGKAYRIIEGKISVSAGVTE